MRNQLLFLTLLAAGAVHANDELDPPKAATPKVPDAVVVKVDKDGRAELFATKISGEIKSAEDAKKAADSAAKPENKIALATRSELDQAKSADAWGYVYNPYPTAVWGYPSYYNYYYGYNYAYTFNYWYSGAYYPYYNIGWYPYGGAYYGVYRPAYYYPAYSGGFYGHYGHGSHHH